MELEEFLGLPSQQVAHMVRASGPKVCTFPINGTRRWFTLEYGRQEWEDPVEAYMDIAGQNHIGLYRLLFEHGIDTILAPVFGPDLLARGNEYVHRIGGKGLARLAQHSSFLSFYDEYDVRVRFYGDHRRHLRGTELSNLSDLFDNVAKITRDHHRFRLFFGAFAHDATQTVAEFSVSFFRDNGRVPNKEEMIEMYYGEPVKPVDLFIGFDRFSVFDMPLLSTGAEDLYFTVSPSPYMDQSQLRSILYDHIFTRRRPEPEYEKLSALELQDLQSFYAQQRGNTLGIGRLLHEIWTPNLG